MYIFCRKPRRFGFFHILDTAAPVRSKYQMDIHVNCSLSRGEHQKGKSHTNKGIQVKLFTFSISLLRFKVPTLHTKAFFTNVKHEILIIGSDFVAFFFNFVTVYLSNTFYWTNPTLYLIWILVNFIVKPFVLLSWTIYIVKWWSCGLCLFNVGSIYIVVLRCAVNYLLILTFTLLLS